MDFHRKLDGILNKKSILKVFKILTTTAVLKFNISINIVNVRLQSIFVQSILNVAGLLIEKLVWKSVLILEKNFPLRI